jgi:hypothetical protein
MDDQRTQDAAGPGEDHRTDDLVLHDDQITWTAHHREAEPGPIYEPPRERPARDFAMLKDLGIVLFLVAAVGAGLVTWNVVGSATSSAFDRPPATEAPSPSARASASPAPSGGVAVVPSPSALPAASAEAPAPTAAPKPVRRAVNLNTVAKPKAVFVSERGKTWCAAAAVQIVLNINAKHPDTSAARQAQIHQLEVKYTSRADSRNGGAGPAGMVATLNKLGAVDYKLKVYQTRRGALREAAKAIARTGHPVILLAWRGAHAWVMTGYKATADPAVFNGVTVKGAYILDPWYPRVSSIWGRSDPPGTYQDSAEMTRNYLVWRRPEGKYPGRDGRFLAIIPVAP